MIALSLSPDKIEAEQPTAVKLILQNTSAEDCVNISVFIRFPPGVVCLTGKKQFRISQLRRQQSVSIDYEIIGSRNDAFTIGFRSFRFRDAKGTVHNLSDAVLSIQVTPKTHPPKIDEPLKEGKNVSKKEMREILFFEMPKVYSIDDIKGLCFALQIEFDEVRAEHLTPLVINLISYCEKRGQLKKLFSYCIQQRPNMMKSR